MERILKGSGEEENERQGRGLKNVWCISCSAGRIVTSGSLPGSRVTPVTCASQDPFRARCASFIMQGSVRVILPIGHG